MRWALKYDVGEEGGGEAIHQKLKTMGLKPL